MPKLVITIIEKTEPISEDEALTGYETHMTFDGEGQTESPLSELGHLIYTTIGMLMSLYHNTAPCQSDRFEMKDKPVSLEAMMAKAKAKLEQQSKFPTEL